MALTISTLDNGVAGHKRANRGTLALDASYPAGGYPVTARMFGLANIDFVDFASKLGYALAYDPSTATVRVYQPNDFALVPSQAIGDVVQVRTGVLGKTATGAVTARSAAPVEVATATDLSAVTGVAWRAEGV